MGPLPVHFAPAEPFFAGFARAASLPVYYTGAERLGDFARTRVTLGSFPQPLPGHLERAVVPARPLPAHLSRPSTLGIP